MKNYILPGEVRKELERRDRLAALRSLPGMIELFCSGMVIGLLAGLAISILK